MKKVLILAAFLSAATSAMAQIPEGFLYQAVIRDSAKAVLDSASVNIRLSIVKDTATNVTIFAETHSVVTTSRGLVEVGIGNGTAETGSIKAIDWSDPPYFIKTQIDPSGGSNYSISGVTKLLYVPYAHYAPTATRADSAGRADTVALSFSQKGDTLYIGSGGEFIIVPGISPPALPEDYEPCDTEAPPMVISTVTSGADKVWMDRNMGAQKVAATVDDTLAFGDYYQWGRSADGHQCRGSDTTHTLATTATAASSDSWYGKFITNLTSPYDWLATQDGSLWQGVNGTNNPCPSGFRVPTQAEWQAEIDSWGNNNRNTNGALNSPLKLPSAGSRNYSSGSIGSIGTSAVYWSSTIDGNNAVQLRIYGSSADQYSLSGSSSFRAYGLSVRCIKD